MLALMLLERHRKNVTVMQVPVGKSGSETANDGESWWEKRHERMEELMKEQEKEAVKRAQARRKAVQNEYLNSQLAAAAYEKSSIILPDNPVIL